jgi:hypothetical protein
MGPTAKDARRRSIHLANRSRIWPLVIGALISIAVRTPAVAQTATSVSLTKNELLDRIAPGDRRVVTRSHSVSVYVDSAVFTDLSPGSYAIQLAAQFNTYVPGGTQPAQTVELRVLFDELATTTANGAFRYLPTNRKVIDNLSLSDKTNVTLKLAVVPLDKDRINIFTNYLKPLTTQALSSIPVVSFLDRFLSGGDKPTPVPIFETTLFVPLNAIEYRTLDSLDTPLLKTEVPVIIAADGTASLKDNSMLGLAKSVVNGTAYLLGKRKVFRTDNVSYGALLHLHFTRSENPVLPADVLAQLVAVDNVVIAARLGDNQKEYDAALARLASLAKNHLDKGEIPQSVYQSLVSYSLMAKAYATYSGNWKGWQPLFKQALNEATTVGRTYGTQVLLINDIYAGALAPVAIPYSLPDDQIARVVNWQTAMHEAMEENTDRTIAVKKS